MWFGLTTKCHSKNWEKLPAILAEDGKIHQDSKLILLNMEKCCFKLTLHWKLQLFTCILVSCISTAVFNKSFKRFFSWWFEANWTKWICVWFFNWFFGSVDVDGILDIRKQLTNKNSLK